MRKLHFALCCLLLLSNYTTQSQTAIPKIVDSAAAVFMQNPARVGLSVGVFNQGQTYLFNYGSEEPGSKRSPQSESVFEIGSVSKTFTGTLLAKAILDRKINPDADIRNYLKEEYPNLAFEKHPILVRHLVTHMSGLPGFLPDQSAAFRHDPDSIPFILSKAFSNNSREQLLKDLHQVKLDTIPGFNYRYSNVGAQLAGIILENVYGAPLDQLLKKFITDPAGMKHTSANRNTQQLIKGYSGTGKEMPYVPPAFTAAGGVYSTPSDMLQYLRFQLDSNNTIAQKSHQIVWGDPAKFAMGLFWRMTPAKNGETKIWHTGGTFGFSSYCVIYPKSQTGIILLTNEMDNNSQGKLIEMADKIFDALHP